MFCQRDTTALREDNVLTVNLQTSKTRCDKMHALYTGAHTLSGLKLKQNGWHSVSKILKVQWIKLCQIVQFYNRIFVFKKSYNPYPEVGHSLSYLFPALPLVIKTRHTMAATKM